MRLDYDIGMRSLYFAGTYPQMVQQSTRSSNNQVDTLRQLVRLGLPVRATHQDAVRLRVGFHKVFCNAVDLQGEFSCWCQDDHPGTCGRHVSVETRFIHPRNREHTVRRLKLQRMQHLDTRNQERQRLSTSCSRSTQYVSTRQQRRNRPGLNLGHRCESHAVECGLRGSGEIKSGE